MEPTSEQELKQLLDEGKITEDEYQELLEALRQKETVQEPVGAPIQPSEAKPRTGCGKAALMLMIAGVLIPIAALAVHFAIAKFADVRLVMFLFIPFLLLGILCEFLAFIFGIIGWKTAQGKIAAVGVPCLGLLIVPGLFVLFLFNVKAAHRVAMEEALGHEYEHAVAAEVRARSLVNHKAYSLDSLDSILDQEEVAIDNNIFAEGSGSLKVEYTKPGTQTIRLFETGPISIDNRMLIYSAKIRVSEMGGKAYLEMLCHIPGSGEFFSRSIDQPVTQTTWTPTHTPFRLETGYRPDNVKLNLVIEGPGTVWIDDIKLSSDPLK